MVSQNGDHPDNHNTLNQVFEALSHPVRRHILLALKNSPPRNVNEFVTPSEPTLDADIDTDTIKIQLHHQHLPFLDDSGFIEWDQDASVVYPGPNLEQANHFLSLMEDTQNGLV